MAHSLSLSLSPCLGCLSLCIILLPCLLRLRRRVFFLPYAYYGTAYGTVYVVVFCLFLLLLATLEVLESLIGQHGDIIFVSDSPILKNVFYTINSLNDVKLNGKEVFVLNLNSFFLFF